MIPSQDAATALRVLAQAHAACRGHERPDYADTWVAESQLNALAVAGYWLVLDRADEDLYRLVPIWAIDRVLSWADAHDIRPWDHIDEDARHALRGAEAQR